jgi:predicted nucleic acid-binding protein
VIVVDTNVISELSNQQPNPAVSAWFLAQEAHSLATTSISLAEVLYGLELLPHGKRRERLSELSHIIFETALNGRVLPFGEPAARHYARLLAARRRRGTPMASLDAQIAAIALAAGASLATRNVTDFEGCGIILIDPWKTHAARID